jgi:hypothetical protein
VSLFSFRSVARGAWCWENDADDPSGFDVPEYFGKPEFVGLDSDDFLFCVIRRIGVHLFRFLQFTGIVCREASPPSEPLGEHPGLDYAVCSSHRSSHGTCTCVTCRRAREPWDGTIGGTITHGEGSLVVCARQRPRLTWTARPAAACSRRYL